MTTTTTSRLLKEVARAVVVGQVGGLDRVGREGRLGG